MILKHFIQIASNEYSRSYSRLQYRVTQVCIKWNHRSTSIRPRTSRELGIFIIAERSEQTERPRGATIVALWNRLSFGAFINIVGVVSAPANQNASLPTLIGRDANRFITLPDGKRARIHALKAVLLKVDSSRKPVATFNTANSTVRRWRWEWG